MYQYARQDSRNPFQPVFYEFTHGSVSFRQFSNAQDVLFWAVCGKGTTAVRGQGLSFNLIFLALIH